MRLLRFAFFKDADAPRASIFYQTELIGRIRMTMDIESLRQWVGKTESRTDQVTAAPMMGLSATLDRDDAAPQPGDALPPLWHWLYFLPIARQAELSEDGHASRGGFLPPVPLPRRMWAGSRFQFHRPLRVGDTVCRSSAITDVSLKDGRTGPLVFVTAQHKISDAHGIAIEEEQNLVYREKPKADSPLPPPKLAPGGSDWQRTIYPDPVLLFRYSALTFNGHRIHYDRPYATEVEGYPGLIVHGPLLATLLLDLVRRNLPDASVSGFFFRAVRPLFDTGSFSVCGRVEADQRHVELWAQSEEGWLAMEATAALR
ncbi:MAG: MaoC family dehydratase N-terminal domain-containing protein [Acidobacteriaceae bacterium]|nr:MaoC family dehydratase N-terminal domain-containing protein [Acidobacteriaceae bacterium]